MPFDVSDIQALMSGVDELLRKDQEWRQSPITIDYGYRPMTKEEFDSVAAWMSFFGQAMNAMQIGSWIESSMRFTLAGTYLPEDYTNKLEEFGREYPDKAEMAQKVNAELDKAKDFFAAQRERLGL
ncbi:hypothetical protein [Streptomyces sp. 900105245]